MEYCKIRRKDLLLKKFYNLIEVSSKVSSKNVSQKIKNLDKNNFLPLRGNSDSFILITKHSLILQYVGIFVIYIHERKLLHFFYLFHLFA